MFYVIPVLLFHSYELLNNLYTNQIPIAWKIYPLCNLNSQILNGDVVIKKSAPLYRYGGPVQAVRLIGGRGIARPFLDHGTRREWGVSVTPLPLFTPGKDPVLIVQEAGWALGPVWTGAENLGPTGFGFPNRPARSQSLYRRLLSLLLHKNYDSLFW
jgi:hypothetical protein